MTVMGVAIGPERWGDRSISPGSSVFSFTISVEGTPSCSTGSGSLSGSISVFSYRFMPNFALNLFRTRRLEPVLELAVDTLEELADELVESKRARKPGADSSSITCCGVP